jgi:ankyrin repeat protein
MHSLIPSPTALVSRDHYNPGLGYEVIDTARFDNAIPSPTTIGIPEAPSSNMVYMTLGSAVVGNDINSARALLLNGENPNIAARGGITPLHCAAYHKNVDMVKLLLSCGASLEGTTDKNQSVLFFAVCGQGQLGSIDMPGHSTATQMGNDLHTDESTFRTIDVLFECPRHFVHLRSSVGKPDKDGVTPLMVAAGKGFFTTAKKLLNYGAQPDQRDHANHTAIKYAAINNHRDVVRLLLEADPAVSHKPDVSHILKLASKNMAGGAHRSLRAHRHGPAEMLIAEEIVQQCRDMGVLDRLLILAGQRNKTSVLECLQSAMARSGSEGSHAAAP